MFSRQTLITNFAGMTSKGMRSVRPGFSKGRKPASLSTEHQGTKSKEPKVAASPNKGAASSIQYFIGDFSDGTTGKRSRIGIIPFDAAKCGFLDYPYDGPRARGTKAVVPKMRKPKAVEPRQNTNPPDEFPVPSLQFLNFEDNTSGVIEAVSRYLKLKDQTNGTKAVEPKMRKPKAVENSNSPHEVVPSFQLWNLEDDSGDVAEPFEFLNLEDDSTDVIA